MSIRLFGFPTKKYNALDMVRIFVRTVIAIQEQAERKAGFLESAHIVSRVRSTVEPSIRKRRAFFLPEQAGKKTINQ